jgi:hypothetical protein
MTLAADNAHWDWSSTVFGSEFRLFDAPLLVLLFLVIFSLGQTLNVFSFSLALT